MRQTKAPARGNSPNLFQKTAAIWFSRRLWRQCDSKANVLTNPWLHRGGSQIFLSRISALIHFRFLGSIWRPR
jgi:hypothetical protein